MSNILKNWKLIGGLLILIVVGFLYFQLKITKQELSSSIEDLNDVKTQLEQQKQAIDDFKTKLNTNIAIIKNYDEKQTNISVEIKKINANLARHDLEKIATKKPKLFEKVINNAANKTNNELMEVTK